MTNSPLPSGTIVRHTNLGVGRVVSTDDSGGVTVSFKSGETRDMSASVARNLKVLPGDGLESLLYNQPDQAQSWVESAPLKLLAATLADSDGPAKAGAIRDKLQDLVNSTDIKWSGWWDRLKAAADDSGCFRIVKNKSSAITTIAFSGMVASVPAYPLPPPRPKASKAKPANQAEWKKWLISDTGEPPPGAGGYPTKAAFAAISKLLSKDVEKGLAKVIRTSEGYVDSVNPSLRDAEAWMEAVGLATCRWLESRRERTPSDLTERVGEILARLAKVARLDRSPTVLLRVARELAPSAFQVGEFRHSHASLDRLLDSLGPEQRIQFIREVVVQSNGRETSKESVLQYVGSSRHVTGRERLPAIIIATLVLTDGRGEIPDQASTELAEALASPEKYSRSVQTLTSGARSRHARELADARRQHSDELEGVKESHDKELENLRISHADRLAMAEQEHERLRSQKRQIEATMSSGREESRLEVRHDVLLSVGDALQRSYRDDRSARDRLDDVVRTLASALRAGGAEVLESVGSNVYFDPKFHHSPAPISARAPVTVSAPGVIAGERVILKANVAASSGGVS